MKWTSTTTAGIILGCRLVAALPPPFVVQGDAGLNTLADDESVLPQLTSDDFKSIEQVKETVQHEAESILDRILSQVKHLTEEIAVESDSPAAEREADGDLLPPHHPPAVIDFSHLTILEIVNASLGRHEHFEEEHEFDDETASTIEHHHPHDPKDLPLHRLAWVVNRTTEVHKLLEKDGITFLAPDDRALTPPRHGRPRGPHREVAPGRAVRIDVPAELGQGDDRFNPLRSRRFLSGLEDSADEYANAEGQMVEDDKDRERRREIIHKIITYILSYHTLPTVESAHDLVDKATVATELESSRIKVQPAWALFPHPYPTIKFNGYVYKRGPTIKAKNGVIHLVGAPLLPPLSPLNGVFLFPTATSTFTSDLQRLGLTEGLLPEMPHEDAEDNEDLHAMAQELLKEHGKDAKTYTLFVPGNFAFNRLPPKILAFLHSPFPISKRILGYVLKYHIVPDIAFFSDFVRNDTTQAAEFITEEQTDVEVPRDWLSAEDAFRLQPRELCTERYQILRRPFERSDGLPMPPRPRFPRPSFPKRPPGPPGHDRDHDHDHVPPHHGHETHRANVTHYRLPTLLSVSGQNPNATLPVAVVKYRFLGKGPIRRSVIVLPHREDHGHDHDHDHVHDHDHDYEGSFGGSHEHGREHGHPPPARPVKVFLQDLPARNGAVQVVETLLRPPMPHYEHHDHKSLKERNMMRRYLH